MLAGAFMSIYSILSPIENHYCSDNTVKLVNILNSIST